MKPRFENFNFKPVSSIESPAVFWLPAVLDSNGPLVDSQAKKSPSAVVASDVAGKSNRAEIDTDALQTISDSVKSLRDTLDIFALSDKEGLPRAA